MTHRVDHDSFRLSGSADESYSEPHAVVVLPDEVDLATTPGVLADIRRCLAERPDRVIVDVSGVRFLGSTGISALLQARDQAERYGVGFRLIGVDTNRPVRRVLTITGVIGLFDLVCPGPLDMPRAQGAAWPDARGETSAAAFGPAPTASSTGGDRRGPKNFVIAPRSPMER